MKINTATIKCKHEPWCSKPKKYCRYLEKTETLDKYGNVVEVVEPANAEKDLAKITCMECGKEAWLTSRKQFA